jgi:flagellar biosynthesis/type III secretory pathway protein FliH
MRATSWSRGGSVTSLWSKVLKPPYDVEARPVRVGAPEGVMDVVQQEAEEAVASLLARAREEALAILQEAEAEAAEIRSRAREEGHREGRADAEATATQAVARNLEPLRAALEEPLAELRALTDRVTLLRDAFVLDAAATLAEHIVGEALEDRDRWIRRAVRLVEALDDRDSVRLFVPAETVEFARAAKERLEGAQREVQVLVDEHLKPSDLLVEGTGGGMDGRVTESLIQVVEGVLHAERHLARDD